MKAGRFLAAACLVVLCAFGALGWRSAPVEGQSADSNLNRQEVLAELEQLAQMYGLKASDFTEITGSCQQIITEDAAAALKNLQTARTEYVRLIVATNLSLKFVANNLAQVAEDTSEIEALQAELSKIEAGLTSSLAAYELSLRKLFLLVDTCLEQPLIFAAGLKAAAERNSSVITDAEILITFASRDFKDTLVDIRRGLPAH